MDALQQYAYDMECYLMSDFDSPSFNTFQNIVHFLSLNQIKLEKTNDE